MLTPERIDPRATDDFNAWYDAWTGAIEHGRDYPTSWSREEMLVGLTRPEKYWAQEIWVIRSGSSVAGALFAELPLADNTDSMRITLGVLPAYRRQGYGTALYATARQVAAERNRTLLLAVVEAAIDEASPGKAFAERLGFTLGNTEIHRVLELPLDETLLTDLAAQAAERHAGYKLVTWQNRCPDELIDAFADLHAVFAAEAPSGEVDHQPEVWDAERIRFREQQSIDQGRHGWITVAIAPDGTLAGHTELYVPETDLGNIYQWDTLVVPAHRGHRLGLALKVRNHLELQHAQPAKAVVHTWNAQQNDHMNAVNAQLGFRPVEAHQEWQQRL
ncbi:GNAT family N-acetyltransferase [Kribbella deserti]|uniref:GNAT family N-acetyltransferase n=1 Tax=Kribbella deserti TaxID=1926257 RepID=A0ABV6QVV9_9ACTN